jgi:hypothetical protein
MSMNRPDIPADMERKLMVECGHRCACCGEPTSLDKAHIIPWSQEKARSSLDGQFPVSLHIVHNPPCRRRRTARPGFTSSYLTMPLCCTGG